MRESPSLELIELLQAKGAKVDYNDPYIPQTHKQREHDLQMTSKPLTAKMLGEVRRRSDLDEPQRLRLRLDREERRSSSWTPATPPPRSAPAARRSSRRSDATARKRGSVCRVGSQPTRREWCDCSNAWVKNPYAICSSLGLLRSSRRRHSTRLAQRPSGGPGCSPGRAIVPSRWLEIGDRDIRSSAAFAEPCLCGNRACGGRRWTRNGCPLSFVFRPRLRRRIMALSRASISARAFASAWALAFADSTISVSWRTLSRNCALSRSTFWVQSRVICLAPSCVTACSHIAMAIFSAASRSPAARLGSGGPQRPGLGLVFARQCRPPPPSARLLVQVAGQGHFQDLFLHLAFSRLFCRLHFGVRGSFFAARLPDSPLVRRAGTLCERAPLAVPFPFVRARCFFCGGMTWAISPLVSLRRYRPAAEPRTRFPDRPASRSRSSRAAPRSTAG